MYRGYIKIVWLSLGVLQALATVHVDTVTFGPSERPWHYVGKFGYGLGRGEYHVRARLKAPQNSRHKVDLRLHTYLDTDWDSVPREPDCGNMTMARSGSTSRLHVPRAGGWGVWSRGAVVQSVRPHIWYFALSTCDAHGAFAASKSVIDVELHSKQPGGSHFGVELQYALPASLAALGVLSVFLVYFAKRCYGVWRDTASLHTVIWALALTMALQYAGHCLHLLHLWRYRHDGRGTTALDAAHNVLCAVSQVLQALLLVSMALGHKHNATLKHIEYIKPTAILVTLAHGLVIVYGEAQQNTAEKHHAHEGAVGWMILVFRLALYTFFMGAVQELHEKGGLRVEGFLKRFQLMGSAHFLAYPVNFVVAQAFAPYLRHPVMHIGQLLTQTLSFFWFMELFFGRGSHFELPNSQLPYAGGGGLPSSKEL